MVKVLHLGGQDRDVGSQQDKLPSELHHAIEIPLDFLLELLGLHLNLLEGLAILMGNIGVKLFEDGQQEAAHIIFDLDGECLAHTLPRASLPKLVTKVEFVKMVILFL